MGNLYKISEVLKEIKAGEIWGIPKYLYITKLLNGRLMIDTGSNKRGHSEFEDHALFKKLQQPLTHQEVLFHSSSNDKFIVTHPDMLILKEEEILHFDTYANIIKKIESNYGYSEEIITNGKWYVMPNNTSLYDLSIQEKLLNQNSCCGYSL